MNHRLISILAILLLFHNIPHVFASNLFQGDDGLDCPGDSIPVEKFNITLSAWIRLNTDASGGPEFIIGRFSGGATYPYSMRIEPDPLGSGLVALVCEILDSGGSTQTQYSDCTSGPCISSTEWHHVACVFNEDTDLIPYINGSPYPSLTVVNTIDTGVAGNISIGYDGSGGFFLADADVSDVSIYNRTLSRSEISTLYNSRMRGTVVPTTSRVGYWPLDDFADGTAVDTSSFVDRTASAANCTGIAAGKGGTAHADFIRYQ